MNGSVSQKQMDLRLRKWQRTNYLASIKDAEEILKLFRCVLTDKETAKAFIELLNATVLKEVREEKKRK